MSEHPTIVIGAGTAGSQAARALGRAGRSVVIAERDVAGGTCLWRGCVPKKALYAAGRVLHQVRDSGIVGITAPPGTRATTGLAAGHATAPEDLDWDRTRKRQTEVMRTYAGDQEGILRDAGVEVLHGAARFASPDTVEIAGDVRRAGHILVATGARPVIPSIPGGELMDTSDDALFYDELPVTLVVVGGGYVAMEMAAIYAAFGTEVRVLVRGGHVLTGFDPECAQFVVDGLRARGVDVRFRAEVREVRGTPGALTVVAVDGEGHERAFATERALAATGRRPDLVDLDLAAGEVEVDDRGRPRLDHDQRSVSNPRVWFAGDAAGGTQLTPVAGYEGRRVAEAILSGRSPGDMRGAGPRDDDPLPVIPSTCFTVPEVARAGLLESELAARGAPYKVARGGFEYTAQAIIRDERQGLVKLLFDGDDRLIGGHLAGPSAGELIYALSIAVQARATVTDLQRARAVHPTLAEAISWAASSPETVEPGGETPG
ncbi:MAG: NAD(P)/FAD-dependent oxidoreductase [Thermoleophilia bacterium]|nr:NAD(P)/FAD-dependent oxidoreductase [Thermoleophilia bacterium]